MWWSHAVWAIARHGEWAGSKLLLRHLRMLLSALAAATPSTFSSDVQHGLASNWEPFSGVGEVRDGLTSWIPWTWNVCKAPSSGICHSSPHHLRSIRMRKAWFLWYNLSRILHYGSSDFPWGTGFGPWHPHLCTALSMSRWTSVHTSGGLALGFVSVQRFGPLRNELQWGKSNNPVLWAAILFTYEAGPESQSLSTSERNDKHARVGPGSWVLVLFLSVCMLYVPRIT